MFKYVHKFSKSQAGSGILCRGPSSRLDRRNVPTQTSCSRGCQAGLQHLSFWNFGILPGREPLELLPHSMSFRTCRCESFSAPLGWESPPASVSVTPGDDFLKDLWSSFEIQPSKEAEPPLVHLQGLWDSESRSLPSERH